jgi:FkbM family methyltransferase
MLSVMDVDGITVHFRDNTPDLKVIRATLVRQELASLKELVPDPKFDFIIDAGGYIGTAAIALARMFPRSRVITVEPSLENFALLEKNIAPFGNIVAVNAALVGVGRQVNLYDRRTGEWGFTILQHPRDQQDVSEIQSVQGVTISDLLARFDSAGIDVLKLDIEGGEREVFEHSDPWIDKVGVVVAELHDRIQEGCKRVFYSKTTAMRDVYCQGEKVIRVNDRVISSPA